jgi:hypothetical protein
VERADTDAYWQVILVSLGFIVEISTSEIAALYRPDHESERNCLSRHDPVRGIAGDQQRCREWKFVATQTACTGFCGVF